MHTISCKETLYSHLHRALQASNSPKHGSEQGSYVSCVFC